jgi:hypothetical protein
MMLVMRTTINLPDDVYNAARSLSALKGVSLGEAVAELAREGARRPVVIRTDADFPCFDLPPGAEPITLERTLAVEDEL